MLIVQLSARVLLHFGLNLTEFHIVTLILSGTPKVNNSTV
jgi:hypothetical protein